MLASLDVGFSHIGVALWHEQIIVDVARFEFPKTKKKQVRSSSDRVDRAQRWTKVMYDYLWDNEVQGVIGELPSGGGKSMHATSEMNCATVLSGSLCTLMELPCEWCAPNDVKKTMCNKLNATKQEIINAVVEWLHPIIEVEELTKSTRYNVNTQRGLVTFPKTKFDDVADALAVYKVMETSNMVRMYG